MSSHPLLRSPFPPSLLISDISRAPPRGMLCEFVPLRGAGALDDFITGILLQLSGRYGDGAVRERSPRVHVASAAGARTRGRGKKERGRMANPPSLPLLPPLRITTLEKEESGSAERGRGRGRTVKWIPRDYKTGRCRCFASSSPVLLTTSFVHFVVLLIASRDLLERAHPSISSSSFSSSSFSFSSF